MKKIFLKIRQFIPLTPRGVLVLLGGTYLLLIIGPTQVDFVAMTLGGIGLALLICSLIVVLAQRRLVLSQIDISLESAPMIRSKQNIILTTVVKKLRVLPLTTITIQHLFTPKETKGQNPLSKKHRLYSGKFETLKLRQTTAFPHRGTWRCDTIKVETTDLLGLTSLSIHHKLQSHSGLYTVYPLTVLESDLPPVFSSVTEGDQIASDQERSGEPFDLKPYHPSDGLNKIAWKIFARSGELISRHPEPSFTPEGTVYVYAVASTQEDLVISNALAYIRKLEDMGLSVIASLDGASVSKEPLSTCSTEFEKLSVESAWQASSISTQEREQTLAKLCENDNGEIRAKSVVVFTSGGNRDLLPLADWLQQLGTTPFLSISNQNHAQGDSKEQLNPTKAKVQSFFVEQQEHQPSLTTTATAEFLKSGWQPLSF